MWYKKSLGVINDICYCSNKWKTIYNEKQSYCDDRQS